MPQSLSKVILHIVFSTKHRESWLDSDVRLRVHAYLATICSDLGADFVRVWDRGIPALLGVWRVGRRLLHDR